MEQQKASKEILKNRMILLVIVIFTSLSLLTVMAIWFDLRPTDLTGFATQRKDITNLSVVYLPQEYAQIFDSRYTSDRNEFIYCLYGSVREDGFLIESIKETTVTYSDGESIDYQSCLRKPSFLGSVHSHPQPTERRVIATCGLSPQDIFTFGSERMALTGVVCGSGKYAFYGVGDFKNPFIVKLVEVGA